MKLSAKPALLAALVLAALSTGANASAKDGDVIVRGACSGASTFKLKVNQPRNGMVETEFEVDQNVNRVLWRVTLTDNTTTFFSGSVRTKAPSGSFRVVASTPDQPGTDTIRARATSPSGEVCSALASV